MNKIGLAVVFGLLLTGCGLRQVIKENKAAKIRNHSIYIAVENSRINEESACMTGWKIIDAFDAYDRAIRK